MPGTVLVLALSVLPHLPGSPSVPGKARLSVLLGQHGQPRDSVRTCSIWRERTHWVGLSRAGRDGPTHVACLEFPRETGLLLRCAGKAGNTFQTTQGNRLSCHDLEGRRGSEEAVPGPSVCPSGEPGVSGDFRGRIKGANYRFPLQD